MFSVIGPARTLALVIMLFAGLLVQPLAHAARADLVDRNGVPLATTVPVVSVYADPRRLGNPAEAALALAKMMPGLDQGALRAKFLESRSFVWVARHVDAKTAKAIDELRLPGVRSRTEDSRVYPQGSLTSHLVGITDYDVHQGMSGAEALFDGRLERGSDAVALSIDVRAQAIVREALVQAMNDYGACGAAGLVLDARTGEIDVLVSLPDFDPYNRSTIAESGYRNKLMDDVYELGGLFEIFTSAAALDSQRVTPATLLDVSHPLRLRSAILRDDEPSSRPLSVEDVFARSSVIGAALIAERGSREAQWDSLRRLRLLDAMTLDGQQVVSKPLYHLGLASPASQMTLGYGYGIAVAPLQAAVVATGIINNGLLVTPTLLRRDPASSQEPSRIVTERTSMQMRALLRHAVTDGTGAQADVRGYYVGGKTGTTMKIVAGKYEKTRRVTWFFAGFPMNDTPRYTLLVMLDEPHGIDATHGQATAQWNAAPTAGRIISGLAPTLGVVPASTAPHTL